MNKLKHTNVSQIERLCQKRALEAFGLDPSVWGVNVQPCGAHCSVTLIINSISDILEVLPILQLSQVCFVPMIVSMTNNTT